MQCAQRKTAPLSARPLSPTDAPKKKREEKKWYSKKKSVQGQTRDRERKQVLARNPKK
jgi:hypothetical protein